MQPRSKGGLAEGLLFVAQLLDERGLFRRWHDVVVLGGWIRALGDALHVRRKSIFQGRGQLREGRDESGSMRGQSQPILRHDDTRVTRRPSTASDNWQTRLIHNGLGDLRG